jgi:hypothetical protein
MRSALRTLLLTLSAAVAFVAAGDASPPQAPTPSPSEAPSPTPEPERAGVPASDIPDFVPSEKLSADDAVAFPVDI